MPDLAIRAESLGKNYLISHRGGQRYRYKTLREDLLAALRRPLARLRGAGEQKERFWAIRDISLEVREGEVLGIVGRNGAGKSTLLKILSRITEPSAGYADIYGRIGSLLEVGTGFHPELTGRENIFLNGGILGMTRREIQRRFDEIVEFAEVEQFLDTPVKRYSSGMYVRLAFAVAAHLEPEILVVDEVLAVGDAAFQKKCLGKMSEVSRSGRTVLFVSHNMSAVRQLCDRAALLEGGRLQMTGPVDAVIDRYLSQGAEEGSRLDLSEYCSDYGNGELTVLWVELLNAVGNNFAIRWDEPLRLRVRFLANQRLRSASFAWGTQALDEMPIFTVRSSDRPGGEYNFEAGEEREIEAVIYHNLRAGHYILVLGIASGSYNYFYHPAIARLEVLDVGSGDAEYLYKNIGLINLDSEWNVLGR